MSVIDELKNEIYALTRRVEELENTIVASNGARLILNEDLRVFESTILGGGNGGV